MAKNKKDGRCYVGVDVGGTKILAALANRRARFSPATRNHPRSADPEDTFAALVALVGGLLTENEVRPRDVRAMGITVPGIIDSATGNVVITPNMNLSGFPLGARLEREFGVPIALGNDVSMGTLGEQWLGAAALADSAVGIFVGTASAGNHHRRKTHHRSPRYGR